MQRSAHFLISRMFHARGLLFFTAICVFFSVERWRNSFIRETSSGAIYFFIGETTKIAADWTRGVSFFFPSKIKNEFLLFSALCQIISKKSFSQILKKEAPSFIQEEFPRSQTSWRLYQTMLSQLPVSEETAPWVHFLEKRWLAKANGFFPSIVDWICPCFGISVQSHPETTSSYARDPATMQSRTYKNRLETWKRILPQGAFLILTRSFDLKDHLPSAALLGKEEKIGAFLEKVLSKQENNQSKIVLDLSPIFPENAILWIQTWEKARRELDLECKKQGADPHRFLCIHQIKEGEVGGIRLLPIDPIAESQNEANYQFLLQWVSLFGLSANPIELDRPFSNLILQKQNPNPVAISGVQREEFISFLNSFEKKWKSDCNEKNLMLKGELLALKSLFESLSEANGVSCPTRSAAAKISIFKIKEELERLDPKKNFFNFTSQVEQIHGHLTTLIEIFSPFVSTDFHAIYRDLLTTVPKDLKPLTSCAVHAAGMTSLGGIFKAAEKMKGSSLKVLLGDNTYFENIHLARMVADAIYLKEAKEADWEEVDLILAQFNPALRRIDIQATEYKVEKIDEILKKAMDAKKGKPFTLAIDCTLDFINSWRMEQLMQKFQKEIQSGLFNLISYRSGLKFDLFGMDNFFGAPLYMIHNQDPEWAPFDSLLTDPVLLTDRLSLNWFCLAYKSASSQLELYRKQVFDLTRSLMNRVPKRLFRPDVDYRIIFAEPDADPAFLDIKVFGPFHKIRASAFICGTIFMKFLEAGHPIFTRRSLGFAHPNFSILFGEQNSTIRLTLGLDPSDVDLFVQCFQTIDALNKD